MQTKTRPTQLRYRPRLVGFSLGLFTILAVLLSAGLAMAATEVTSCGQVVSGSAFLSGDLDCSSSGTDAVVLAGGSLDLRGFTITGDPTTGLLCGVRCTRSCKVFSTPHGGAIVSGRSGVCDDPFDADLVRSIRVKDLLITGSTAEGIALQEAGVRVTNSTISNTGRAVAASSFDRGGLRVVNSTITNNNEGLTAVRRASIRDSVISGNSSFGVSTSGNGLVIKNSQIIGNGIFGAGGAGKSRFIDSTISGNGEEGIRLTLSADRLKVLRTTIDGNGSDGIFTDGVLTLIRDSTITNSGSDGIEHEGRTIKLLGTTISGNALHGIRALGSFGCDVRAVDSTLTGNGSDPSCGVSVTCADIASCAPPSLSASTCDTSYDTNSGFPGLSWGVCALD